MNKPVILTYIESAFVTLPVSGEEKYLVLVLFEERDNLGEKRRFWDVVTDATRGLAGVYFDEKDLYMAVTSYAIGKFVDTDILCVELPSREDSFTVDGQVISLQRRIRSAYALTGLILSSLDNAESYNTYCAFGHSFMVDYVNRKGNISSKRAFGAEELRSLTLNRPSNSPLHGIRFSETYMEKMNLMKKGVFPMKVDTYYVIQIEPCLFLETRSPKGENTYTPNVSEAAAFLSEDEALECALEFISDKSFVVNPMTPFQPIWVKRVLLDKKDRFAAYQGKSIELEETLPFPAAFFR